MYVCTYVCMYVCMYVRTYVCMYICMYACMCMYVRINELDKMNDDQKTRKMNKHK